MAQAGEGEDGRAILRGGSFGHGNGRCHGGLQAFPEGQAGLDGQVVGASANNVGAPIRRNRNPRILREEERLLQNDAPERVVLCSVFLPAPVLGDALAHVREIERPVGDAEGFPGEADGQKAGMGEDAAAHDEVFRAMQLEQEEFAGEEGAELAVAAGLPEVDFVELWAMAEQVEPLAIRYPDEGFHWKIAEFTGEE